MIVNNFQNKKLVQYLKDGMNICIKFRHGLGDTIMFYPVFQYLKKSYPNVNMTLCTFIGQQEYFGKFSCEESDYDIVFQLKFPCCEFNVNTKKYTKPQLCCIQQLGIDYSKVEEYSIEFRKIKSPLVAVHFQSTSCPAQISINDRFSKLIYDKIIENGLIPIQVMFKHQFHRSTNTKYRFIDCTVRQSKATINNLIGLMQHCCGFAGCASGPFHIAMSLYPDNVLFLKNQFDYNLFTHQKKILSLDVHKGFNQQIFDEWINKIKM